MIPLQRLTDHTFRLAVIPGLCDCHPDSLFLFGGAGMAAGLTAIEAVTGRRLSGPPRNI